MSVTAGQIIARGLTNRCPNCGGRTLFARLFKAADQCRICGLKFERDDGFYLGAIVINYTLTALLSVVPACVLVFLEVLSVPLALALALGGCLILPLVLYRPCKSVWLMIYYVCLPHELPANARKADARGPG
ncbi:MAG TPA: DUF983 domain-containing protein [Dehalococcoidia bacterium]|jgi:uncharacterized protein (DUF983 family)|nr:DUF983 domain-containing protein [Dehalococcoidia bacterium]